MVETASLSLVLFALISVEATTSLDGTYVWAPYLTDDGDIELFMEEINSLGMKIAIIGSMRTATCENCGCDSFDWQVPIDWLQEFLDTAALYNIQVYVGLTSSSGACLSFYLPYQRNYTIEDDAYLLSVLPSSILNHTSLAGWYIPDEADIPSPVWIDISLVAPYYKGVVDTVRAVSNLPVTISPYLKNARTLSVSPTEIANRAQRFAKETGIDLQIWQDSVGADGINVYNSTNTWTLAEYYAALAEVLPIFWSDNEAFNWGWELKGGGYYPCSMNRFATQLDQSEGYVAKKVTWIQQRHFGTVDPYRFDEAPRLLAAYRAWYNFAGYIVPFIYTYGNSPSATYPDPSCDKLNNGIVGDPRDYENYDWVGVLGSAEVIVDVSTYPVDWVAVDLLCRPDDAIYFPASLSLYTSIDQASSWTLVGEWDIEIEQAEANSEYIFGNLSPLQLAASSSGTLLKIALQNSGWTFLSEIEITTDSL